jgi:hypothetical protein
MKTKLMKEGYTSLSIAIKDLQEEGYNVDFNLVEEGIESKSKKKTWAAGKLDVVKFYRFEGATNPSDNSILYVIETEDGEKGLLVDNYDASATQVSKEMLEKLKIHHNE